MDTPHRNAQRANLIGALWMVLAMAAFAVEDVAVKAAAQTLPVGQILTLFGVGGALVFAALARARNVALLSPDVWTRPMWVRAVFEVLGRLFYLLAITLTPLSSTTVILQATPLVVVAGAAIFLGERVGPRRWLAIGCGLLGVLVILRPGGEGFSALSIFAVLGMLGFAGRDLASRAAPRSLGPLVLGFFGFVAVTVAGALVSVWDGASYVWPDWRAALCVAGAVASGVLAYGALMTAMRTGDVAAVTPFRYSRLLFGVAFGVLLFDETLGLATVLGAMLIVLSGVFILWRGQSPAP